MAELEEPTSHSPPGGEVAKPIQPGHPDRSFPVLFIDGVTGMSWGPNGIVKFYMFRSDPEFHAQFPPVNNPVCQVVMSADSLAAVSIFFQKAINLLKDQKVLSQEQIDKLEASWSRPGA